QRTRWVIDASHPYAEVVSQNIVRACASVGVLLSRYQRPEQLSDLRHPLLHVVGDLNEACAVARRLGERILLTATGPSTRNIDFSLLSKTIPVMGVNGAWHLADR
ncbi:precorrin-6A/cobalt-precorrin-6A reductase, partial [Salmonella sp. s51944]|uniref:precorrin-6A/cobalt-precorrin-6A reductase n=1 Tax=Salmonella sp. s51944 TaxID=3159655 RepID=UPI00397EBFD0